MVRDRDETETFDFQPETRWRPRTSHVSTRPRRDWDVWKLRLETVSRPRRRDRDYIPVPKPFDTINHSILFRKLLKLSIPSNILLWIFNFLTDRMQTVSSFGQTSTWLPVTQSIIQGSGIGPCLYLIYASDLCTLSPQNVIIKYADDTTLLVAQHSLVDMAQEYYNVCSWSTQNKLSINIHKTKEIIFLPPCC